MLYLFFFKSGEKTNKISAQDLWLIGLDGYYNWLPFPLFQLLGEEIFLPNHWE